MIVRVCVFVCFCRGLWGVGGSDGGGGKGTEEVNTRSGMTQLCGGLVPKTTHTGACVCVRAHATCDSHSLAYFLQSERKTKANYFA